jgi:deoxyribodipyrimidine photo-lyase
MTRARTLQVVWFKRDLRVADHRPLAEAASRGPVLPIFVIESEYWRQTDAAWRHWAFIRTCLQDLDRDLTRLGQPLRVFAGEILEVLSDVHSRVGIETLWSHVETGNDWTYRRDLRVAAWTREHAIEWVEYPQNGVIRRLRDRAGWASRWEHRMREPVTALPVALRPVSNLGKAGLSASSIPETPTRDVAREAGLRLQEGGRDAGLRCLDSFLSRGAVNYQRGLSSPVTAWQACSRLSPHLAWGSLSLREVVHALRQRQDSLAGDPDPVSQRWRRSLRAFDERLHWHCHFMQKLESQPDIEFRNVMRACDGLRESEFNSERYRAWCSGETGLPLVDACMRALHQTGWINFRMRAMLVSMASYQLWLHWREPALHLARLFTDYEPGIHFNQVQMQSGTTGINALRIYNPVKQSLDHDPEGMFIRSWIPELRAVPNEFIHEPWKLPPTLQQKHGVILDRDYPQPIVDPVLAAREARQRLIAVRRTGDARDESAKILQKMGSRKKTPTPAKRKRPPNPAQGSFEF